MPFAIGERGLIARPHTVDPAGHNGDPVAQKRGGGHFPGPSVPFHESEPGGAVDGDEEIQLALSRLNPSNINVIRRSAQRNQPSGSALNVFFAGLSPSTSGSRLMSCRCKQRGRDDRVRCGIVGCDE